MNLSCLRQTDTILRNDDRRPKPQRRYGNHTGWRANDLDHGVLEVICVKHTKIKIKTRNERSNVDARGGLLVVPENEPGRILTTTKCHTETHRYYDPTAFMAWGIDRSVTLRDMPPCRMPGVERKLHHRTRDEKPGE